MLVTIDTDKDLDKLIEIVMSMSEEQFYKLFDKIKEYKNKQFFETHKNIADLLKNNNITKDDMIDELKKMRKENSESSD